jgi:hypothetical protein
MGKGEGSGSGDWTKLGMSIGGAAIGSLIAPGVGTAAGWQLGSMGGDILSGSTGMKETGGGVAGMGQTVGNLGSSVAGMTSGSSVTPQADATKGFSGITSYGDTAKDVGGTNAWGQALGSGKGVPTIPTENGYGKLGDLLTKSMDTAGSIMKAPEGQDSSQGNLQPMQMTAAPQMAAPNNLSSVIAAQLMNPAAQNRIAFQRPGRM